MADILTDTKKCATYHIFHICMLTVVFKFMFSEYSDDCIFDLLRVLFIQFLLLRAPGFLAYLYGISPRQKCWYWYYSSVGVVFILALAQCYFMKPLELFLIAGLVILCIEEIYSTWRRSNSRVSPNAHRNGGYDRRFGAVALPQSHNFLTSYSSSHNFFISYYSRRIFYR